jgi:hypothetical protein
MLDAAAAVAAVTAPSTTQPLAFATPAAPAPGESITLDGSTSVAGSGRTIPATGYQWTLVDSGGIATLVPPANAASAVVTTSGAGTFTVRLDVTDDGGGPAASTTLTVSAATPVANPPSNSGGDDGGGSMSWPWMLALGIAVTALRPRRR